MSLGNRIRSRRKQLGLTQVEIAEQLKMGRSNFGHIENERVVPSSSDLNMIADILKTSPDYLLGKTDELSTHQSNSYYALTSKDEKDIAEELEKMMARLDSDSAISYHGEPLEMDDNDRELLRLSFENSLRVAKQIAKKKFTPKKYRN
ncbi:helix-turn-helix transcriptional regulator [Paenibacillus odorifer]|uniref:helix-turn-helix domain-containing protein n=1 Tax=Paenibacillus TaxID=44249 RepID=UPI00096DA20C|nr:helix-turn-helix transcriptional regulator [Paenibacillus odorifer]OMC95950.1 transcriptional regulator [Paenibacillus odorifer]